MISGGDGVPGDFICVRQRAGPLVKAFSTDRACFVRRSTDSKGLIRRRAGPAMCRTSVDKLEFRIALYGYDGVFYTLTFAPEHLPRDLAGVQRVWDAFLKRLRRWEKRLGREPTEFYIYLFYTLTFAPEHLPRDLAGVQRVWDAFLKRLRRWEKRLGREPTEFYIYRIEGLHGDHRFHIHAFLRDSDFPPAVVRYLWDWGEVDDEPWDRKRVEAERGYRGLAVFHIHAFLRDSDFPPAVVRYLWDWGEVDDEPWDRKRVEAERGYRGLAVYFTKEVPEVGRHPWHCSRALSRLLPLPDVWFNQTGEIRAPSGALRLPISGKPNLGRWGVFSYIQYLEPSK